MTDDVSIPSRGLKDLTEVQHTTKGPAHPNTPQHTQAFRTKFPKCFYFIKTKNIIIIISMKERKY